MSSIHSYLARPLSVEFWLRKMFPKTKSLIIFDIGTCEGEDSIRYSRLFPNSVIYAFEPLKENYAKAEKNFAEQGRLGMSLLPFALSDKTGKATFHVSSGNPEGKENTDEWNFGNKSSSLLEPGDVKKVFNWLRFNEERIVDTLTLHEFMRRESLDHIDYIHMDVQGAELAVLQGAGDKLKSVSAIWLEVEKRALYKSQPLKKDLEDFLQKNGFRLVHEEVDSVAGDQLYINPSLVSLPADLPPVAIRNENSIVKRALRKVKSLTGRAGELYSRKTFAQSGEDIIVDYIFRTIGINTPSYIDVGAHHPFHLNNTALFYLKGCRGINIEPDPVLMSNINRFRPADINLNIGIGNKEEVMTFYRMDTPTLNTFSEEEALRISQKLGHEVREKIPVMVKSLDQVVMEHCNGHFPEFLSVDVEGFEMEVLQSVKFGEREPVVICMETISYERDGSGVKNTDIIGFLNSKGYMVYADTYINTIFIKKNYWHIN